MQKMGVQDLHEGDRSFPGPPPGSEGGEIQIVPRNECPEFQDLTPQIPRNGCPGFIWIIWIYSLRKMGVQDFPPGFSIADVRKEI
jgi:hypothetical protein